MKNLRRLALIRIRADSVLSRQYWSVTGGWRRRIFQAIGRYFGLPLTLILLGGLLCLTGVAFASGWMPADKSNTLLLAVSGIPICVALLHSGLVVSRLVRSQSLAVLSVLPEHERDYVSRQFGTALTKSLLFLAGLLLSGAGFAFGAELNQFETAQVLGISCLLWAITASLSVIVIAYFPAIVRQEVSSTVIVLLVLFSILGVLAKEFRFAQQDTLILVGLLILPTGWPILMIKYGVILKLPEAWWLLVPTGCVVTLAMVGYSRLLSRYRIQEFVYEPGSVAVAEFRTAAQRETAVAGIPAGSKTHPTDTVSWLRSYQRRLKRWLKFPESDEPSEELTREQAIARIHESGLTRRFNWSEAGFVERTIAKLLKDEELLTAEILSVGGPRWSWTMARSLVPATIAVMIVVAFAFLVNRQIAVISGHIGIAGFVGTFMGSRWAGIWKSDNGDSCAALALLPVDTSHVSRMVMTLGAIRSLLIFPLALGVILAIDWGHRGQVGLIDSTLLGAKVVLILAAVHQWWFVPMQPHICPQSIWKTLAEILIAIVVVGVMIAGICMLLVSGRSETYAVIGAGLLFGTGWMAQRIQANRVLKSPVDFVMRRPTQLATTQQQREKHYTGRGPTFWPRPLDQVELP